MTTHHDALRRFQKTCKEHRSLSHQIAVSMQMEKSPGWSPDGAELTVVLRAECVGDNMDRPCEEQFTHSTTARTKWPNKSFVASLADVATELETRGYVHRRPHNIVEEP